MRLPRPTKINQRLLGSAVVGLLAANAFAAAVIAGDTLGSSYAAPPVTPEASTIDGAAASAEAPRSVSLITTADGHRLLADPSTAEGRKAIADARRDGGNVQEIDVPATAPGTGRGGLVPGTGSTSSLDLGSLLGALGGAGHGGATPTTAGGGTNPPGVLEIGEDIVRQLITNPGGTITSVVGSTQSTVTSVVGSTQSTVSSVLAGTPSTITSVVGGAQSTVTSVLNQAPAPPTTSLLGSIITTVSTVVQSVTPTTSAPPPPPPTTAPSPVCGLLAHC